MNFQLDNDRIVMNGINLSDVLDVTDFKVEAAMNGLGKVWIEGFIKGPLVMNDEKIEITEK